MTILITILFFLVLGIAYILYCVRVAPIDEGNLEEERYDPKKFAKPSGWKVGKLPKEFENHSKVPMKSCSPTPSNSVVDDLLESWGANKLTRIEDSDFPE